MTKAVSEACKKSAYAIQNLSRNSNCQIFQLIKQSFSSTILNIIFSNAYKHNFFQLELSLFIFGKLMRVLVIAGYHHISDNI